MSRNQNVSALKPEFEEFTERSTVRVSSDPTNPSRREGYFRPAHKPGVVDKLKSTADRHRTAGKRALAAGTIATAVVAGTAGLNALTPKADTGLETSIFAEANGKELKTKPTKVIIRNGASIRTSPAFTEDDSDGSSSNVAFKDKTLEVTEGVYYGNWLGFQLDDVQSGGQVSPAEAADNTYWINLTALESETRPDGTSYASEYPLEEGQALEDIDISLGADGAFHDEQNNRVAVAHEISEQ